MNQIQNSDIFLCTFKDCQIQSKITVDQQQFFAQDGPHFGHSNVILGEFNDSFIKKNAQALWKMDLKTLQSKVAYRCQQFKKDFNTKIDLFTENFKQQIKIISNGRSHQLFQLFMQKDSDSILQYQDIFYKLKDPKKMLPTFEKNYDYVSQMFKNLEIKLNKMMSQFENNFAYQQTFQFSQDLKNQWLTIAQPTTIKCEQKFNFYPIALLQPALDIPIEFGFKIINLSFWIGVGMCHLNERVQKQFQFNDGKLGHGLYILSDNGRSWSSTHSDCNDVKTGLKFDKYDTIRCNFDPIQRFIQFRSDKWNNTLTLYYNETSEQLYPCVVLEDGSIVEFIQPSLKFDNS